MSATYDLGDSVKLTFLVRVDGILTNATVTLVVTAPDGTTSNPSISNPATGTYTASVAPAQAGQWTYKWGATGAATTSEDGIFIVEPNISGTLYTTVSEVRQQLGDSNDQEDAGHLEASIRAVSRAIDQWCGRRFWLDPALVVRTFEVSDGYCAYVNDIGTTTGLLVKTNPDSAGTYATTWAATDYLLEPLNASANGGAYSYTKLVAVGNNYFTPSTASFRPGLQVTARWGWSQVPEPVRAAATIKAVALWKRKDAPLGVMEVGDFGVRIGRDDPTVVSLLSPYRLIGIA